jgi:(E)-4-hydroxy-3-methylbut-2-enyl-diphosphate synthase
VKIGGGNSVAVQTMTNTKTEDVHSTLEQIYAAESAGCDLIRISCPTAESTLAVRSIIKTLSDRGSADTAHIPIIADIHFDYRRAIEAMEAGVQGVRINPGNIGNEGLKEIVKKAKESACSLRIGINSGSIERDVLLKYGKPTAAALVESAVLNCKKLEDLDYTNFKVSVKSSDVRTAVEAYRKLSEMIEYPLHLGITESGTYFPGTIKSSIGIGTLLMEGIGDTIRVSLSGNILDEIKVGRQILKSIGMLNNCVDIVSCPTCSRALIDVIGISQEIERYCENIRISLKISILGCVVNGPGEAMTADIGVFGFNESGLAKIYVRGKEKCIAEESRIVEIIKDVISEIEPES